MDPASMASMFGAAVGGKASHVEMLKVITEKLKAKMAEDGDSTNPITREEFNK